MVIPVHTRAKQVLWPRVAGLQRCIPRRHHFAAATELGMVNVDPIVNHRNGDATTERYLVSRLDIGMRIHRDPIDRGFIQMPLLWKNRLARQRTDQLRVAKLDVVPLQ